VQTLGIGLNLLCFKRGKTQKITLCQKGVFRTFQLVNFSLGRRAFAAVFMSKESEILGTEVMFTAPDPSQKYGAAQSGNLEGLEAVRKKAWHVYWRYGRTRAASLRVGSFGQFLTNFWPEIRQELSKTSDTPMNGSRAFVRPPIYMPGFFRTALQTFHFPSWAAPYFVKIWWRWT